MPPASRRWTLVVLALVLAVVAMPAQQMVTETRDPAQAQDEDFAKSVKEWTTQPYFISPLVDHLPKVEGVPSPKDVLGYHVGAPAKLTYYADIVKYYRALETALPGRVKIETIGKSDENRELVVVWISSDDNLKALQKNRDNLARLADPRRSSDAEIRQLHRRHQAAVPPDGRAAQRRDRPFRNADGARLSAGDRNVAAHPADSRQRLRVDHAGRRSRRPRSQRRLVLSQSRAAAPGRRPRRRRPNRGRAGETHAAAGGGGGGRGGTPGVPYWGKYVFHDNNRDINLSQVSMRAITDWYFTAHPPIMHDLHESQPLLYTYSGAAPQNPNLDPILFAELPFFSNFELAQMTKWGMPGVYTHAFMDGWSPGYLGSVAYNHNGMMRMYETQAGNDITPPAAPPHVRTGARRPRPRHRRPAPRRRLRPARTAGAAAMPLRRRPLPRRPRPDAKRGAGQGGRGRGAATLDVAAATCRRRGCRLARPRRGDRPHRPVAAAVSRANGIAACRFRRARSNNWSRRNNANYMQTGVLSGLQLTSMIPNLVLENFYQKTRNSIESGRTDPPFGFVIPVQRDMTRVAELLRILRAQGIEIGRTTAEISLTDGKFPGGSYVIKRDQPYGRLAKNLLERQSYPDPNLRTYDDSGWTMGLAMLVDVREIKDKAILDVATTPVTTATHPGQGQRQRDRRARWSRTTAPPTWWRSAAKLRNVADEDHRPRRHDRRRGVSRRLVRDRAASRPRRRARGGAGAGADRGGRRVAAHGADARGRSAAGGDLLGVDRHAGDRLGPLHLRSIRDSVRADLQGAGAQGQPARRLRRHRHADADAHPPVGLPAACGARRCRI